MQCPIDGETLVMSDRHGVEIDYCPKCRGVWLDRGELDKIIERAAPAASTTAAPSRPQSHDRDHDRHRPPQQPYRKKKESFLSDLFDF